MLPVVGCGPTDTVVEVEEVVVPAKAMLEDVAETGELGSASMEIRDALEGMKVEGDAAKADALLKELDELDALSDPNQIKKKASSMAGQL
jgi:hypothetical protein